MCICGEEARNALSGPLVGLGWRYLYPDTHPFSAHVEHDSEANY